MTKPDLTPMTHAALALANMAVVTGALLPVLPPHHGSIVGAAASVYFYLGREVAQAEHRLGPGPWWRGFDFRKWDRGSRLDLLAPVLACAAAAAIMMMEG